MPNRRILLTALGASLGLAAATARSANGTDTVRGNRHTRIPNPLLYTHEGKAVRFYDDLIKDKLVVINMMYAACEGICPKSTTNLLHVQNELGERVGRDIFMYSITLQPRHDTPAVLKEYVEMRGIKPGWLFLTGKPDDIEMIRRALGFYNPDPKVDGERSQHTGMVRIGNDAYDRWHMTPALGDPEPIVEAILRAVRPAPGKSAAALAGALKTG